MDAHHILWHELSLPFNKVDPESSYLIKISICVQRCMEKSESSSVFYSSTSHLFLVSHCLIIHLSENG